MRDGRALSCMALGAMVLACGGPVDLGDGSALQWERALSTSEPPPMVDVFVVDDGDQASSAMVRQWVVGELEAQLTYYAHEDLPTHDPARWDFVTLHVILAFPSAAPEARLTLLSYEERQSTAETRAAFVEQVRTAIDDRPAPAGPFLPIATMHDVLSLLAGARPPRDDRERTIQGIPQTAYHGVLATLAAGRDDEGSSPIVRLPQQNLFQLLSYAFVPASPDDGPACHGVRSSGRLAQWLAADPSVLATGFGPMCDDDRPPLLSGYRPGSGPICVREPARTTSGASACEISVDVRAPTCDAERGWLPTTEESEDPEKRRCEVRQHQGDDLDACRTELDADVPSGWCWTDVPELWGGGDPCAPDDVPIQSLRFTGGAGLGGSFVIRCRG